MGRYFVPENSKKKSSLQFAITSKQSKETENCSLSPAKCPLIFNRSDPVPSTGSTRTETNFPLNVLVEDVRAEEDV